MSMGRKIRRSLGRFERPAAELYRSFFVNLDSFSNRIRHWADAENILEIGCGEGALAERLVRDFPTARYLGIDIIADVGRLYQGERSRATFLEIDSQRLAAMQPATFDLVVINDVLHHVPYEKRLGLLSASRQLLSSDGSLVLKDWILGQSIIHYACYIADVYIGGDKSVRYMSLYEQRSMLNSVFGHSGIIAEATIPPWQHNHAFLVRPS